MSIEVRPDIAKEYGDLLGPPVLSAMEALSEEFSSRIDELVLGRRVRFQEGIDRGDELGFLPPGERARDPDGNEATARQIREGAWRVCERVPIPADLQKPGLQGTGPAAELSMLIGALNSGSADWMFDWEDALGDRGDQIFRAFRNLQGVLEGRITEYTSEAKGKRYVPKPRAEWPTVIARHRGLHLKSRQILLGGRGIPATVADIVIYAMNCHDALARHGSGVYLYSPKIQSHEEALVLGSILRRLEERMGLPRGTLKTFMLNERPEYAVQQEEIMWVMRENLIGTNVGRWDYLSGHIVANRAKADRVLPDPDTLGMKAPFMDAYSIRNVAINRRRGAIPVGGMNASMKNPRHPEADALAVKTMRDDKTRERRQGYRKSWTATIEREYVAAGQEPLLKGDADVDLLPLPAAGYDRAERDALFAYPPGPVTRRGLGLAAYYASQYMAGQQTGNNAVAIEDPSTKIRMMNDFATFEIFWHWLWTAVRHRKALGDGGEATPEVFRRVLAEEEARAKAEFPSDAAWRASKGPSVFRILERLVLHDRMLPYGAEALIEIVDLDGETERRKALDAFLSGASVPRPA